MISIGSRIRIVGNVYTPRSLIGLEGVVESIGVNMRNSLHIRCDGILHGVFFNEVVEIMQPSIKALDPSGLTMCGICNDTITQHKRELKCGHEIYVCCDCNARKANRCEPCAKKYFYELKYNDDWLYSY